MPKDLSANTEILYSRNSFTQISVADIQRLQAARLSGTTTRVYLLLKSHCFGLKTTCFPSLKRLAVMLGLEHKSALKTICRSLNELEDAGLIERNGRKQKNRFVILPENGVNTELPKVENLLENEVPIFGNRRKQYSEKEETPPLYSPPQAEESKIQKLKERNVKTRIRKSPAERREAKAKRAAERAQRQRTAEREAQRTSPIERKKRLKNALDWIALRMPVECLMEGDKEHLEGILDEWINGLSPHRRKLFDINSDHKFRSLMILRISKL